MEYTDSVYNAHDTLKLSSDLTDLSKLKPNEKFLGLFPLKTSLYLIGSRGIDEYIAYQEYYHSRFLFFFDYGNLLEHIPPLANDTSKFRKWLTIKAGEPPHLIDTSDIEGTVIRMENFLYNKGFFYPHVDYSIDYNDWKNTATVNYRVTLHTLYRMRHIYYNIGDSILAAAVHSIPDSSNLRPGAPFDVGLLKSEQYRITDYLRNEGYYDFQKDYIYFEVDSTSGRDSLDIFVRVSPPAGDSVHHPYKIRSIYIYTNATRDMHAADTSGYTHHYVDSVDVAHKERRKLLSDYYIVSKLPIYNPKTLANHVFFNPGMYYSDTLYQKTVTAFSNLGIFKFVSIQTVKHPDSTSYVQYMDLIIRLDPLDKRQISTEFNVNTTSDYLLGNSVNFIYGEKNLFHNLDLLTYNLKGDIETQFIAHDLIINTSEVSTGLNLGLPIYFYPFPIHVPKRYFPKTNISLNLDYVNRVNFYTIFNTSFEYSSTNLIQSKKQQLILKLPVPSINIVKTPTISPEFDSILQSNLILRESFQEQLITGYSGTYIFNSQAIGTHRDDGYIRATLEFNMPFADFVRFDCDLRNYFNFHNTTRLILRGAFGIAVPFANTSVIPYVKQFFVGGAYSVRAFQVRKLGPGTYLNYDLTGQTPVPDDQTGDIKLEFNAEYRFKIIGIFEGAVFCDAGNIWTLHVDYYRPGSKFRIDDFYKELGVGPGAGLRLNFSYFIIRFDAAYPLYDPALDGPRGDYYRSYYNELGYSIPKKSLSFNLAIGYPF